jgi:hypothetical protein
LALASSVGYLFFCFSCQIEKDCLLKHNNSSYLYYCYEEPNLEYLRCNHPELLNAGPTKEEESVVGTIAEEVNGDLELQMCQLKL